MRIFHHLNQPSAGLARRTEAIPESRGVWLAKMLLAVALPLLAALLWMSAAWVISDFILSDGWQPISAIKLQLLHRAYSPDTTFLATVIGISAALPLLQRVASPDMRPKRIGIWRPMVFAMIFCSALSLLMNCIFLAVPAGIPNDGFAHTSAILKESYGAAGKPLMFLAAILTGPVFEEIIFRGFSYGKLRQLGAPWAASAFLSALSFGIYHGTPKSFVYTFVTGMAFCILCERYNTLLVPIAGHCAGNAAVFAIDLWPKAWNHWDLVALWMLVCGIVLFYSIAFLLNTRRHPISGTAARP